MVEVRHESFLTPAFIELLRKHSVAPVLVESDKHPLIADVTGDFVYARLQRTSEKVKTGYPRARSTSGRSAREAWPTAARRMISRPSHAIAGGGKRDVFIYMISGAKVRAPAAAMALIERLK